MPLTFADEADYDGIEQGDELKIPNIRAIIAQGKKLMVQNKTRGTEFEVLYDLSERERETILAGGTLSYIKARSA